MLLPPYSSEAEACVTCVVRLLYLLALTWLHSDECIQLCTFADNAKAMPVQGCKPSLMSVSKWFTDDEINKNI